MDVLDLASGLRARGEAFALATVVRTVSMTAAKAGAKAVIRPDGSISAGWIGGGCARAAVLGAARAALADGVARLVSVQPQDVLADAGHAPGDERDGVRFARNLCPSQGTMDVFVEPVLPRPCVLVCGGSPVAVSVADLLGRFGFRVVVAAEAAEHAGFAEPDARVIGYDAASLPAEARFAVVATQGRGDAAALRGVLAVVDGHVAFVGSRRKAEALRAAMAQAGIDAARLQRLRAPAGLDLGAVTPEEIALSIVAEIVCIRRRGQQIHATAAFEQGIAHACPTSTAPPKPRTPIAL